MIVNTATRCDGKIDVAADIVAVAVFAIAADIVDVVDVAVVVIVVFIITIVGVIGQWKFIEIFFG